jgi:hypothetical protein
MIYRLLRKIAKRLLVPWKRLTCVSSFVLAEKRVGREVRRLVIVAPARQVQIGRPDQDAFIPIAKYYTDGSFEQPDIFVAEIEGARLHVGSGLVCTPRFKALADTERLDRLPAFSAFGEPKPRVLTKRTGTFSTIHYCYAANFWHWMIDCLPKIISLERALPGRELTLLMPDALTEPQRESLLCLLPPGFSVEYLPPDVWVEAETFYWPSLASGRCNAFLPPGYFDEIRARTFARYGLTTTHRPRRRLYLTRRNAKHRRVENEDEVWALLQEYSFEIVEPEKLTFREQVELFHSAALVVGPHGAGLASTLFSGEMTLLVFYATQKPPNYFHTQTRALGQRHLHLLAHADDEDANFPVNVEELRALLESEVERSSRVETAT